MVLAGLRVHNGGRKRVQGLGLRASSLPSLRQITINTAQWARKHYSNYKGLCMRVSRALGFWLRRGSRFRDRTSQRAYHRPSVVVFLRPCPDKLPAERAHDPFIKEHPSNSRGPHIMEYYGFLGRSSGLPPPLTKDPSNHTGVSLKP